LINVHESSKAALMSVIQSRSLSQIIIWRPINIAILQYGHF